MPFGRALGHAGAGDGTALLSALAYAAWMVALGRHAGRFGQPFTTGAAQILATAAVGLAPGTAQGGPSWSQVVAAGPELLYLGIVSTGLAFTLQIAAQRVAPASQGGHHLQRRGGGGRGARHLAPGRGAGGPHGPGAALIMGTIALAVRPVAVPVAAGAAGRRRAVRVRGGRLPLGAPTPSP